MKKVFSDSKPRIVIAEAVTILLAVLCLFAVRGEGLQRGKLILALFLSVLAGVSIVLRPVFPKPAGLAAGLLIPALTVCCMEFFTHVPQDLTPLIFLLNYLFYLILDIVCSCLLGNARWGYILGNIIPMLFGTANYFVVSFRSSPIVPWDFLSLRTAATVTDNYTFTITYQLVFVILGFVWLMVLGEKIRLKTGSGWRARLCACAVSLAQMGIFVSAVQTDLVKYMFGLDDILFTPNVLYRNNGLAVAFLANLQYLDIEKPDHYSAENAEAAARKGLQETEAANSPMTEEKEKPNVIVIMNEAFSDLKIYGDFETSEDYMPFIRSLKENTVKGNLYVSVKGGNTANTEFEFLTGNTMAFLPAGSVPYQQFIKDEMPSLATHMKGLGYTTAALHPYFASGWNRDQVYDDLGFDAKYFRPEFPDATLLRGWVDDKSSFERLKELYEEKGQDEKLFAFEVTMQNHGGYSKEYEDLGPDIKLTGYPEEYKGIQIEATEKYLTLIRKTDEAFQELLEYFEEQEEPTIILMFGDHQPSEYVSNPILNLLGKDTATLESSIDEFAKGYAVPFIMWANYDIEEEEIPEISANYLSSLLMEKAGLPKSGFQTYLKEMQSRYPIITGNFYRDGETDELCEIGSLKASDDPFTLNSYATLQYNDLRDGKNRLQGFFGD